MHKAAVSEFKRIWALIACVAGGACVLLHAQDFKKQVIYQIITDRFYDGDPTNDDPACAPMNPCASVCEEYDARKIELSCLPAGTVSATQSC